MTSSNGSTVLCKAAGDSYERKAISWVDLWLPGDCGLGDTTASLLGEERDERVPSELFWNSLRDAIDKERHWYMS